MLTDRSRNVLLFLLVACLPACSIKRMAVNKIGNALASGGSSYETDNDPELVAGAIPFSLKLMESLLAESPKHTALLTGVASGFTEYAYVFVDQKADELRATDLERSDELRERARKLYLRAHAYGVRGLETRYPRFASLLESDAETALSRTKKRDVPLLYWTAASLGLAISGSQDKPEMIGRLPLVQAIIQRVVQLDEEWNAGAVPEFLISIEGARSDTSREAQQKAMRSHFEKALAISKGKRAATYVTFAENACVPAQNAAEFKSLLQKALAIDTESTEENRLPNLIAQHRAKWLLGRMNELFLQP